MEEEFADRFGDVPDGTHAFAVMNRSGDTKTMWDPRKPIEVEAAKAQFEKLVRENRYSAFRVDKDNPEKPGERMKTFDPEARRIIFVPPVAGG